MVPAFGVSLPCHPPNAVFLRAKILRSQFFFSSFVASLHQQTPSNCGRERAKLCFMQVQLSGVFNNRRRTDWSIYNSADGRGLDPLNGQTRLIKAVQNLLTRLNARIQGLRKDLPKKLFSFLVGFYCATAFATVIGQTGDWDILSAALAVVVVEGIGALMYKASIPLLNKTRSLIVIFNYWKAGLAMGLFLDSFKY